jgi:hypothetical protein
MDTSVPPLYTLLDWISVPVYPFSKEASLGC